VVPKKQKIYPASYEMKEKTGQCWFLLETTSLLLLLLLLLILHKPTKKHLFKKGEGEDLFFFLLIFILFLHKSQRKIKRNGKGDTLI